MQSSSTNASITSSSNGFVYPFPPYIFPFSSSSTSSSSQTNLLHHLHPHQENPLALHQDQFSQLNNFLQPITENTMHLNLGGASIMSSNEDYHQHYVYDDRIDSNIGHHNPYLVNKTVKVPPVGAKKDRHSKIFTAQGFRDRRVRLSIDVARDFFDLQDLLGFDKASKTIEWLLSKSRSAIVDLAKSKCHNDNDNNNISPSLSSSNTTESNDGVCDTGNERKTRKRVKEGVTKLMERALRVKARSRERERTKEKKSSSSTSKMCSSSHLSLFNTNEELGSSALLTENHEHVPLSGSSHVDRIRSLELNLRKMEASSSCCSPNNNIQFPGSVSTNWEINGGGGVFAFPSFSSITTNMNLNSNGS